MAIINSPESISVTLAERARALRLEQELTQQGLAELFPSQASQPQSLDDLLKADKKRRRGRIK